MFDNKELYERLCNGESAADIAKEMTDALNAAVAQKTQEDTKANDKQTDADAIADYLNDFAKTYYNFDANYTGDLLIEVMDMTNKLQKVTMGFTHSKSKRTDDDAIDDFLGALGLK